MSDTGSGVELWMPQYIQERRAKASTLNHIEHSALDYLEMLLWEHSGTIPNKCHWIAKNLKLTLKEWAALRETLLAGCEVSDTEIIHPKIKTEHAKAVRNRQQKIAAGKASADARAKKQGGNARSTTVGANVATAGQPPAGKGSGKGKGPSQVSAIHKVEAAEKSPLRVVEGGL